MFAVGIPSYNEVDNIAALVKNIDDTAQRLGQPILIINADNNSPDGTARRFVAMKTMNPRVSLMTETKGKGRNIRAIIEYIAAHHELEYCMLVDGDITSFEEEWLIKHLQSAAQGADFTVPSYARNMQEGNTTNHFAYPLLAHYSGGKAPRQPIAGDFGISSRFAEYLQALTWPAEALGYGIDIFLTMHALFGDMRVREISLGRKLHKPSFGKMVPMFSEVASSYYAVHSLLWRVGKPRFESDASAGAPLLQGAPIAPAQIEQRVTEAERLFEQNIRQGIDICPKPNGLHLDAQAWVEVLVRHEAAVGRYSPAQLAASLTPFYLLRATTYLQEVATPEQAVSLIDSQAALLAKTLSVT